VNHRFSCACKVLNIRKLSGLASSDCYGNLYFLPLLYIMYLLAASKYRMLCYRSGLLNKLPLNRLDVIREACQLDFSLLGDHGVKQPCFIWLLYCRYVLTAFLNSIGVFPLVTLT